MEKPYTITVLNTGQTFLCKPGERILETMLHSGEGYISHGCCGGGCGICKMKIVSGRYRIVKKMSRAHISEEEQAHRIVLICCVEPVSDLTISSIEL